MIRGRITVAALAAMLTAALASGGCARKPAQKSEAGQVASARPPTTQPTTPPATQPTTQPATQPATQPPPPPTTPPTTEAGCRACNGQFGQHGIDPTPKCLCRTKDSGKRCRGKDDCEAECVADGGEREVTQAGPPPLGFRLGRCAEFRATFGCHVFLPPKSAKPVRLDVDPEQMCVD